MVHLVELVEPQDLLLGQPRVIFLNIILRRLVPLRPVVVAASDADVGEDDVVWHLHLLEDKRDVPRQRLRLQDEIGKVAWSADPTCVPAAKLQLAANITRPSVMEVSP